MYYKNQLIEGKKSSTEISPAKYSIYSDGNKNAWSDDQPVFVISCAGALWLVGRSGTQFIHRSIK